MHTTSILVVEDEILVAENIKSRLIKNGYIVSSVVVSGEEAIEQAEKHKPDLVLMDIVIKGKMDGIETAELIRERFSIPVIFLTAHADQKSLERAKITDPFGYITKPFEERQLSITIEMALYKDNLNKEKEKLIQELRKALEKVKLLSGLLPICSYCKKIRDDRGYWKQVVEYIRDRSEAEFSHSICPECMKKYYPDIVDKK